MNPLRERITRSEGVLAAEEKGLPVQMFASSLCFNFRWASPARIFRRSGLLQIANRRLSRRSGPKCRVIPARPVITGDLKSQLRGCAVYDDLPCDCSACGT